MRGAFSKLVLERRRMAHSVLTNAVKPLNKGHIGDGPVVPCREVVLFQRVSF